MDNQNNTQNIEKLIHDGNQFAYDQNNLTQIQSDMINKHLIIQNQNLQDLITQLNKTNEKLSNITFILLIPYIISIIGIIVTIILSIITGAQILNIFQNL